MANHRANHTQRKMVEATSLSESALTPGKQLEADRALLEKCETGQLNRRERRHREKFMLKQLKTDETLTAEQKRLIADGLKKTQRGLI